MANRNFEWARTPGRDVVCIPGSFAPNGTSAVDATTVKGVGFTVARTGTGTFTITLADSFNSVVSVTLALQLATSDDKFLIVNGVGTSTVALTVWDVSGAAAADVALNANNRINFCIWTKVTSIP